MSGINRARINGKISRLVHEYWKSDHTPDNILAQADLIKALQQFSDTTIEMALTEAYEEGCHDTIKKMEDEGVH